MSLPERVDVLVIGGGIQGAGVLQAAAAAGLSALLVEERSPAFGTSSRSSKLIHGGLRYLETLQLGLVRESLHERALLLRNAPELVRLVPFFLPVYSETSRPAWKIRAGLSMYAALGGLHQEDLFRRVPRRGVEHAPRRPTLVSCSRQRGMMQDKLRQRRVPRRPAEIHRHPASSALIIT